MTCERKKNLLRSSFLYLTPPQLQMESIRHRLPRRTFVLLMYITGKSNNPAINYWWSFPAVFVALLFQWCRQLPCEDCACIAKKHLLNIGRRYISNSTVLMLGLSLSPISQWVYKHRSLLYRSAAAAAVGKYSTEMYANGYRSARLTLLYTYPCFVYIYSECRVFYAVPHMIEHGIEFNIFF